MRRVRSVAGPEAQRRRLVVGRSNCRRRRRHTAGEAVGGIVAAGEGDSHRIAAAAEERIGSVVAEGSCHSWAEEVLGSRHSRHSLAVEDPDRGDRRRGRDLVLETC